MYFWCGRGDSNPHGLGPPDFKSGMSTIPSRPHGASRKPAVAAIQEARLTTSRHPFYPAGPVAIGGWKL